MGPISNVEMHRTPGKVLNFSSYCLSSSLDGTIKLWNMNSQQKVPISAEEIKPIITIDEHKNYIHDSKWSPIHPAVFASCDVDGNVSFYY